MHSHPDFKAPGACRLTAAHGTDQVALEVDITAFNLSATSGLANGLANGHCTSAPSQRCAPALCGKVSYSWKTPRQRGDGE